MSEAAVENTAGLGDVQNLGEPFRPSLYVNQASANTIYSEPATGKTPTGTETREPECREFCCSTFRLYQDALLTRSATGFKGQILPLFSQSHFSADIHYRSLEPSLRLASNLLRSEALLPFLNIVADGETRNADGVKIEKIRPVELDGRNLQDYYWEETISESDTSDEEGHSASSDDDDASDNESDDDSDDGSEDDSDDGSDDDSDDDEDFWFAVHPKPGQNSINEATRSRATAILRGMAGMIDFAPFTSSEAEDSKCASGTTVPVDGCLSRVQAKRWRWGCRSHISLHNDVLEDLKKAEELEKLLPSDAGPDADAEVRTLILNARLTAALTLAHEFAHALGSAVYGPVPEPYYMDTAVAEMGFQLEYELFGGLLAVEPDLVLDPRLSARFCEAGKARPCQELIMTLSEWPSPERSASYKALDYDMDTRKGVSSWDMVRRVPWGFVETLFTNDFWQHAQGRVALNPPFVACWPFLPEVPFRMVPYPPEQIQLDLGVGRTRRIIAQVAAFDGRNLLDDGVEDWADILESSSMSWLHAPRDSAPTKHRKGSFNT